ncbi:MAG: NAD(P)H-dependent glycerol-3-phosphate dehydrogenase [Fusobacteriaceae bacterium]|nr:NAD(P)H-dependent glycerol-3-phosphate dehydrogenase [Fusobacteriaceae bacterium]
MKKIVVIGAGSWGTALSLTLAKNGHEIVLWEYDKAQAELLRTTRENKKYLGGITLPDNITVVSDEKELLHNAVMVVFSIPSQILRSVVKKFSNQITDEMVIVNTGKGIEIASGLRLSEVIKEEILGKFHKNIVVLSGPTHAEEVALGLPTTIVAAGNHEVAKKVQEAFNNKTFRVYSNSDIIGVEIGAAVKNCLAIGAGIADGMGYGDNTKAALITRGLAEMIRYGVALGADEKTFTGLTGIGDLIVTCASKHSRNRYVGENLGKGKTMDEIMKNMVMVAEGVPTVKAVYESAQKYNIEMPIVKGIYEIIYNNGDAKEVVKELMTRELKGEF